MIALFCLCLALFVSPFKSKSRLEAENAAASQTILLQRERPNARLSLDAACNSNGMPRNVLNQKSQRLS
jgi:hypothetical protein